MNRTSRGRAGELATREPHARSNSDIAHDALFMMAPEPYVVTDANGSIYQANLAASRLFNVSQDGLQHKPLGVLIAQDHRDEFRKRLAHMIPNDSFSLEVEVTRRDDGRRTVDVTGVKLMMPDSRERIVWL